MELFNNPFRPSAGQYPPYLAGREKEKNEFLSLLKQKPIVEEKSRISWIMQSWHESESADSKISNRIRILLKTARKYKTGFEAAKISLETKLKMPIWHHHGIRNNYYWNKKAAKCLRNNHSIKSVGDLENYIQTSHRFG